MLQDGFKLNSLDLDSGVKLYFKDLGPQISWTVVSNSGELRQCSI